MGSTKGRLFRLLSGLVLERAAVVSVQPIGSFQRVQLRCDMKGFSAGAKVQLLLPSDDMRTYSPIRVPDGMVLLGWTRAGGPGTRWMLNARAGEEFPFVGPQRSLVLNAQPVVLVGDETSVGVAAAFSAERPGEVHAVIQSDAASDVRDATASVGLHQVEIVARGDIASTIDVVASKLSNLPHAVVGLTGGSELVVGVRHALRRAGVRNIKTKTYWIPGKAGLD